MKMSCSEEDEDKEQSTASSCVSMKSDKPKDKHLDFRTEPGPSESKDQQLTERVQSSASSCRSEKSDRSKQWTEDFRTEPGPSASKMGFVSKPSGDEPNQEFSCYELSETDCEAVAFALKSNPSHLTELDLSGTILQDSAVKTLCDGLKSPNYKVETLRLRCCSLSDISCEVLVSALKSNPSHLTELVLDGNNLQDSGVLHLCGFLESPDCRLKTLSLRYCRMSDASCGPLGSAFESNPSHVTELDLTGNDLQDSGVKQMFGFLKNPDCRLKTLRLRSCSLSLISCEVLVSALKSNPSNLTELDLSENRLLDSGLRPLCGFLQSPDCRLQTLRIKKCSLTRVSCEVLVSALKSNRFHLKELDLIGNYLHDSDVQQLVNLVDSLDYVADPVRWNSVF